LPAQDLADVALRQGFGAELDELPVQSSMFSGLEMAGALARCTVQVLLIR
jgi:hypothetical protein